MATESTSPMPGGACWAKGKENGRVAGWVTGAGAVGGMVGAAAINFFSK